MGKPIGLGSIKIDVVGMFMVNRQVRYTQTEVTSAELQRYSTVYRNGSVNGKLPAHLKTEETATGPAPACNPEEMANRQMKDLYGGNPALYRAIVLTGNPAAVMKPVHYPQLKPGDITKGETEKGAIEMENFKWFVRNDHKDISYQHKQFLKSFKSDSSSLHALLRHEAPPPKENKKQGGTAQHNNSQRNRKNNHSKQSKSNRHNSKYGK